MSRLIFLLLVLLMVLFLAGCTNSYESCRSDCYDVCHDEEHPQQSIPFIGEAVVTIAPNEYCKNLCYNTCSGAAQ